MKTKLTKTIAMLCLIASAPSISGAVHGGQPTNDVMKNSLVYLVGTHTACSGVLVAKDVVLTAAHCKDSPGRFEKVVLITPKGEEKRACNTTKVIESAYAPGAARILPKRVHAPDIVLLKLESEICSGEPALLSDHKLMPGDQLELTGYGGGSGVWNKSQQISLEILPMDKALTLSTSKDPVFEELLKLSPDYYSYAKPLVENTTACGGDSGGPVFINEDSKMNLLAITGAVFPNKDLGADKCNNGYLHLVTPIAPYYDWINSQIELWSMDFLYARTQVQ